MVGVEETVVEGEERNGVEGYPRDEKE